MPRALLIPNPSAARADAHAVTAILKILGRGGWNVDLRTITGPGDARRIAEESLGEGFDVLVSHGGDGTAMQVAAGIAGSGISLGVVPGGTGHVLAGNLRLPRTTTAAPPTPLRACAPALEADGAFQSASAVMELFLGGAKNGKGRRVWWARGRTVRVEVPEGAPRPVQLDGDVTGETPFEARLLPGALSVLVGPRFKAHHG